MRRVQYPRRRYLLHHPRLITLIDFRESGQALVQLARICGEKHIISQPLDLVNKHRALNEPLSEASSLIPWMDVEIGEVAESGTVCDPASEPDLIHLFSRDAFLEILI
jgi:hypothetical protein